MCGNNIETYRCGHSIFAGMNLCADYSKLTENRTPLCEGINASYNPMNIVRRHTSLCLDCWEESKTNHSALRAGARNNNSNTTRAEAKNNDNPDGRLMESWRKERAEDAPGKVVGNGAVEEEKKKKHTRQR
ncbi:hypothetical protein QBC45DRAFT_447056 [Copromyces sp. CBS 386.78]|nr:hypothetical protein QBC45DRAFT_447056 [Copromyces sp. CBS 386.78]